MPGIQMQFYLFINFTVFIFSVLIDGCQHCCFQNRFTDFFPEYSGKNDPDHIMEWLKQQFLATNQVKRVFVTIPEIFSRIFREE